LAERLAALEARLDEIAPETAGGRGGAPSRPAGSTADAAKRKAAEADEADCDVNPFLATTDAVFGRRRRDDDKSSAEKASKEAVAEKASKEAVAEKASKEAVAEKASKEAAAEKASKDAMATSNAKATPPKAAAGNGKANQDPKKPASGDGKKAAKKEEKAPAANGAKANGAKANEVVKKGVPAAAAKPEVRAKDSAQPTAAPVKLSVKLSEDRKKARVAGIRRSETNVMWRQQAPARASRR
jgi:hypothetical protein